MERIIRTMSGIVQAFELDVKRYKIDKDYWEDKCESLLVAYTEQMFLDAVSCMAANLGFKGDRLPIEIKVFSDKYDGDGDDKILREELEKRQAMVDYCPQLVHCKNAYFRWRGEGWAGFFHLELMNEIY